MRFLVFPIRVISVSNGDWLVCFLAPATQTYLVGADAPELFCVLFSLILSRKKELTVVVSGFSILMIEDR